MNFEEPTSKLQRGELQSKLHVNMNKWSP